MQYFWQKKKISIYKGSKINCTDYSLFAEYRLQQRNAERIINGI